jgi:hypothetical protein
VSSPVTCSNEVTTWPSRFSAVAIWFRPQIGEINLRLPTAGGFYAWELDKGGREVRVLVEGQLAFNNVSMIVSAAEDGSGWASSRSIRWPIPASYTRWKSGVRRLPVAISIIPTVEPSAALSVVVDALRLHGTPPSGRWLSRETHQERWGTSNNIRSSMP